MKPQTKTMTSAIRKLLPGVALFSALALPGMPATAAELTFSRIGAGGDQALQKVWGMTPDEVQRYKNFMEATGKRYENATPLMVLSIMADSQEDRIYYAKKAAEVEHNLVKREIEAAWYISEAMSEDRLEDEMQRATDALTGIETLGYVPTHMRKAWQDDDEVVVVLDERCLSTACITGIGRQIAATAPQAPRLFVIDTKQPLDEAARTLINSWTGKTEIRRLDPIEHAWLEKAERKALAAQAHPLNPVVLLGAAGLTPAVLQEIDRALTAHELIKVRLAGMDRDARQAASEQISDSTSSAAVQLIGNVLVLYRPKPEEDDPA